MASMKTNSIQKINVYLKEGSTFSSILTPTQSAQKEEFIVNDFLEFSTDFKGCYGFAYRLCSDIKCSADMKHDGVNLLVAEKPLVEPNAITGIPKLKLSVEKSKPFSSFIYIGVYSDEKFKGQLGVIKGLIIVCGQEKVKPVSDEVIKLRLYASETNKKDVNLLRNLFKVDISNTLQTGGDCPIVKYQLCKDKECAKVIETHTHLSLSKTNYVLDSTKPLEKELLYIGATTSIGLPSLAVKKFNILICGYEQILTPKGAKIEVESEVKDG